MSMHRKANGLLPVAALVALLGAGCNDDTAPTAANVPAESAVMNKTLRQIERMGIPAVATVFIPTARKDEYNQAQPVNDFTVFGGEILSHLLAFGVTETPAAALTDALTPDILPINTSQPSGFLNGRRLQDDVITAELGLIFGANAALNDDHVDGNDAALLPGFPYLAAPHVQ